MKQMRFLVLNSLLVLAAAAFGQNAPAWAVEFDGPASGREYASKIAVDGLGNMALTCQSTGLNSEQDIAVRKYDAAGNLLWSKRWNNWKVNANDAPDDITCDAQGNVYVLGTTWNGLNQTSWDGTKIGDGTEYDIIVLKYSPTGALLWQRRYDDPIEWQDFGTQIRVDGQGNVIVAGASMSRARADHPVSPNALNQDYLTLKFNSNGVLLWKRIYNGPDQFWDWIDAMTVDKAGNIIVSGHSGRWEGGSIHDLVTIKYDPNGNRLWLRKNLGTSNMLPNGNHVRRVLTDADGNVFISAWHSGTNGRDVMVLKYTAAGSLAWKRIFVKDREDVAMDMVLDSQGNVIVAADSEPVDSPGYQVSDSLVLKYSSAGALLWARWFNGPDNQWDGDSQLEIDENDNLYVGLQSQAIGYDFTVLKYDPNGNRQWTWKYDRPNSGSDQVTDMVYGLDGILRVSGDIHPWDNTYDVLAVGLPVADVVGLVVPNIGSTKLAAATVPGAGSTRLTVTLDKPAPEGGSWVSIRSDSQYAWPTAMGIQFLEGQTTGTIRIETNYVPSQQQVQIRATYNGKTVSKPLTITP